MKRFWDKVEKTDGCWLWQGRIDKDGYGHFNFEGNNILAHRMAYELCVGPIPEQMQVLHHCDNPPCVCPDHLFQGTPKINAEDREAKGRGAQPSGSKHGRAILIEEKVKQIRDEYKAGATQTYLAHKHGVSRSTIAHIVRNETWNQELENGTT